MSTDLESLFFSLTEGQNRNVTTSEAPAERDALAGQEGANE